MECDLFMTPVTAKPLPLMIYFINVLRRDLSQVVLLMATICLKCVSLEGMRIRCSVFIFSSLIYSLILCFCGVPLGSLETMEGYTKTYGAWFARVHSLRARNPRFFYFYFFFNIICCWPNAVLSDF